MSRQTVVGVRYYEIEPGDRIMKVYRGAENSGANSGVQLYDVTRKVAPTEPPKKVWTEVSSMSLITGEDVRLTANDGSATIHCKVSRVGDDTMTTLRKAIGLRRFAEWQVLGFKLEAKR